MYIRIYSGSARLIFFEINYHRAAAQYSNEGHSFEVCVCACRTTYVISILSASKLHFLANKNAALAGGSQ